VAFQPHRYTRTAALLAAFGPALAAAGHLVLTDIYSAGEDPIPAITIDRLAAAVQLYTDDLSTDDLYDDWLRPQRDYLRDLYLGALRDLADLAMDVGQLDLAIGFLQQAFRKDGTGEAACLSLMTALARAGRRVEALQCYSACEKALAEIGLSPSDELSAAHRGLLGTPLPFWPSSPSASPRPNA